MSKKKKVAKKKTQSDLLRERQTRDGGAKIINNKAAKKLDKDVEKVCGKIFKEIQKEYPNETFSWDVYVPKPAIAKAALDDKWKSYKPENPRSTGPKPDGGIIYMGVSDDRSPVLIVEAKKQGTNDVRKAEGLKKQAMGNAIERAYKNVKEFEILYKNLDYFPYVIEAYGCDFASGSSMLDRLDPLTRYHPRNKDYTLHKDQKTTVFVQEKKPTQKKMYKDLKPIAVKCIKHIKNGKKKK